MNMQAHIVQKAFELYATGAYSMELVVQKDKRMIMALIGVKAILIKFLTTIFIMGSW